MIGAWYGAALQRQKRLPTLQHLLNPPKTRILTPEEKAERQAEFDELTRRMGPRLAQKPPPAPGAPPTEHTEPPTGGSADSGD